MAVNIKTILACLDAPDPNVRVRAVVFLAKSQDRRAVAFLEKAASEDESPQVRYYARKGIAHLMAVTAGPATGAAPKPAAPAPGPDITALAPAQVEQNLASADQWTRLQTVRAIERFAAREYVPLLIRRLGVEDNRQVLSALLLAAGKVGGEEGGAAILPFLKHEDARVRANAIEAVDALGDEAFLVHLIPFLRDPDNRCRANAVLALRRYGRVNVFKTLEDMLRAPEVWMQDSATFVLGRMGSGPKVFELLQTALESDFLVVRSQARGVLERMAERGVERAASLLERLGEKEQGNPEEQLFERLERLSAGAEAASAASVSSSSSSPRRTGPPGKDPAAALAALAALSSGGGLTAAASSAPAVAAAPAATPAARRERRGDEVFQALRALSGRDEAGEAAAKPAVSPAKPAVPVVEGQPAAEPSPVAVTFRPRNKRTGGDVSQVSGAFEVVRLDEES